MAVQLLFEWVVFPPLDLSSFTLASVFEQSAFVAKVCAWSFVT